MRHSVKFAALLSAGWLAACHPFDLEPLPLDVTLEADRTMAASGDSIVFRITAQGEALVGIGIDWGDGQTLVIPTDFARTASTRRPHTYDAPGTYEVTAEATDAEAGSKRASLSVHIQ